MTFYGLVSLFNVTFASIREVALEEKKRKKTKKEKTKKKRNSGYE